MDRFTYIARQPIFDRSLEVAGYELLYRAGDMSLAEFPDGDSATLDVLGGALVEFGLESLVGNRRAFLNVTPAFLARSMYQVLHPARVALEVLEDAPATDDVIAAIRAARERGYVVALDDFTGRPDQWALADHVDLVKVDVLAQTREAVEEQVVLLAAFGARLLAEKIETRDDFDWCRDLGFEMFQGFFFEKPETLSRSSLAPDRLAATQVLAELHRPDASVPALAATIRRDLALTFRVLSVVNSGYYGLARRLESVEQAIVLLGLNTIRNFSSLIVLSDLDAKPMELANTAMVRARHCELLAERRGLDGGAAFMVGLLSVLEAMMDFPLADILARLSLARPVEAALLDRTGTLGGLLALVEAYEHSDLDALDGVSVDQEALTESYLEAVTWAMEMRMCVRTESVTAPPSPVPRS